MTGEELHREYTEAVREYDRLKYARFAPDYSPGQTPDPGISERLRSATRAFVEFLKLGDWEDGHGCVWRLFQGHPWYDVTGTDTRPDVQAWLDRCMSILKTAPANGPGEC